MVGSNSLVPWPPPRCPDGRCHYYIAIASAGSGSIWLCVNCTWAKWLPSEAVAASAQVRKIGIDKSYAIWMRERPRVVKLLNKVEVVRRKKLPYEKAIMEAMIVVASLATPTPILPLQCCSRRRLGK